MVLNVLVHTSQLMSIRMSYSLNEIKYSFVDFFKNLKQERTSDLTRYDLCVCTGR